MKQYITMKKTNTFDMYRALETGDHRFAVLWQILSEDFRPNELIEWLWDEKQIAECNEWVYIRKERGVIALYDVSDSMDETYTGEYLDPTKRFEMSVKNFVEILYQWEELRVARPDVILIVIHEDNHVSLEIDPHIIKEYQDAGYVFDFNKNSIHP